MLIVILDFTEKVSFILENPKNKKKSEKIYFICRVLIHVYSKTHLCDINFRCHDVLFLSHQREKISHTKPQLEFPISGLQV